MLEMSITELLCDLPDPYVSMIGHAMLDDAAACWNANRPDGPATDHFNTSVLLLRQLLDGHNVGTAILHAAAHRLDTCVGVNPYTPDARSDADIAYRVIETLQHAYWWEHDSGFRTFEFEEYEDALWWASDLHRASCTRTLLNYVARVTPDCDTTDPRLPALAETYLQSGLHTTLLDAIDEATQQLARIDDLTALQR